ncbi:MAG: diaminopimelate epimerase [Deltaproteobacteria bacterium]|nr:diaminopimelate epimerase [Deltaproteobacteria bacterium]
MPESSLPPSPGLVPFYKYHGLGNDYLVIPGGALPHLSPAGVQALCQRHQGAGGDGVLVGPLQSVTGWEPWRGQGVPALRIFNPDGSEAEKSGNGLRIFTRFLWETGRMKSKTFAIATLGGQVQARVLSDNGGRVAVEMGRVSFLSTDIPVTGPAREVINEIVDVQGERLRICAASVGNPHCVVLNAFPTPRLAQTLGPALENHPMFPRRANVQFMEITSPHAIRIEIWERGAGYTTASGSSSCAAAAAAVRLGLVQSPVTVAMAGGSLVVRVDEHFQVEQEGDVAPVMRGELHPEFQQKLRDA